MKSNEYSSAEGVVRRVVETSVNAVRPSSLFEESFRPAKGGFDAFGAHLDIRQSGAVRCVAIGKSAEAMAFEARKKLGKLVGGMIATPVKNRFGVEGFEYFITGHPLADEAGVRAGEAAHRIISGSGRDDVLLFLISGGGSASIFVPIEGVTLAESNRLFKLLFDNGVPIDKVNLVRRHLSKSGGGKLSSLGPGGSKLSLIISDVVGDRLSSIASGPTVPDATTPGDAVRFLESCGFVDKIPPSIPAALMRQRIGYDELPAETGIVKIIASNKVALEAAEKLGVENGFNTLVISRCWESDAGAAARALVSIARSIEADGMPVSPPALILAGGETIVRVTGAGKGGRNQHLVLCALSELSKLKTDGTELARSTFFSFGTDGKDGNSDAAGAFANLATLSRAGASELDSSLADNNSNAFFSKCGGLITTGPTDTNVMDIFGAVVI